jgi:hypothetical protein
MTVFALSYFLFLYHGNTTRRIDFDRGDKNINQETLELKKVSIVLCSNSGA